MAFTRSRGLFESTRVLFLPIHDIAPNPGQPRTRFSHESLEELADSIRAHGILQPLSVRRLSTSQYELISGERRLRAAEMAGLSHVPCILVKAGDLESSLLALVENLQRRDLDFVEEATALQKLIFTYHLSQEEAARRVGKSQSAVANKLRLLKLDKVLLDEMLAHQLSERHARALLRLEDEEERLNALHHIIRQHLNVAQTEQYIDKRLAQLQATPPSGRRVFLLKDVRLFLNSLDRGLRLVREAGIGAESRREDTEDAILLTIRIPKNRRVG